jgi:hypothetical protein
MPRWLLGWGMGGALLMRPMVTGGTEMVIRAALDWLFGPVIMLGFVTSSRLAGSGHTAWVDNAVTQLGL